MGCEISLVSLFFSGRHIRFQQASDVIHVIFSDDKLDTKYFKLAEATNQTRDCIITSSLIFYAYIDLATDVRICIFGVIM